MLLFFINAESRVMIWVYNFFLESPLSYVTGHKQDWYNHVLITDPQ